MFNDATVEVEKLTVTAEEAGLVLFPWLNVANFQLIDHKFVRNKIKLHQNVRRILELSNTFILLAFH